VLVPCNFNNDYKKIFLNKFEDNGYKTTIVKFVVVYLSNAIVYLKSSAMLNVAIPL